MSKTITAGMFKTAAFALLALGASVLVALPAAAHSPLAVDQQGQSCVQMDCQNDKITSQCAFPVQLTHECGENRKSFCSIVSAGIYNSAVESGVTVVGVPFASSVWSRNILRPNDFYPMDINRKGGITPIDSDSKEAVRGYACAIHTDGSVTSAGTEWHNDEKGIPRLVCVHTHKDGSKHTAVAQTPAFECSGEFVNNWAAECLEYETKPYEELGSGTRLTNKCECPVIVDACIGGHPCHDDDRRHTVLQPGESDLNSPIPGQKIAWAACFQDDKGSTNDSPKSVGNNLWTCGDVQTPCSKIEIQGDTAVAMQFQALTRKETPQVTAEAPLAEGDSCQYANDGTCDEPRICASGTDTSDCDRWKESQQAGTGAKTEEQPVATESESAEPEDPLAALRGAPPPAGTPTENFLRKCGAWEGQLSVNAILDTEGNKTEFPTKAAKSGKYECRWSSEDTHLHIAALLDDFESARWLITNGADVNAKGRYTSTPLMRAVGCKRTTDMAALLIENGANINQEGFAGFSPIDLALLCRYPDSGESTPNPEMETFLIEHGGKCDWSAYPC